MCGTYELPWISDSNKGYSPCSWMNNWLLHWWPMYRCVFTLLSGCFTYMQKHQGPPPQLSFRDCVSYPSVCVVYFKPVTVLLRACVRVCVRVVCVCVWARTGVKFNANWIIETVDGQIVKADYLLSLARYLPVLNFDTHFNKMNWKCFFSRPC